MLLTCNIDSEVLLFSTNNEYFFAIIAFSNSVNVEMGGSLAGLANIDVSVAEYISPKT